jgi:hypothetical protein
MKTSTPLGTLSMVPLASFMKVSLELLTMTDVIQFLDDSIPKNMVELCSATA